MSTRIDLNTEIQQWLTARYGEEVRSANANAFRKIQSTVNAAIDEIEGTARNINTTLTNLEPAIANAQTATNAANVATRNATAAVSDLQARVAAGEFKGERGERGERGASGVTATANGFFTLEVDGNGDLYVVTADGTTPPNFELDGNGNLYLITD